MKCLCFSLKAIWFPQTDLVSIWFQFSGDSCVKQLLSIAHDIYKYFDDGFEVSGVFLDIWKAFDKIWYKGIIFKLKQNDISGKLFSVLYDFLKDRKQRVILNGQVSSWAGVNAGVLQGSILGPLLFLVYINELADGLSSNAKLFGVLHLYFW